MEEDHNISAEGHKQSQETEILQYLPNQKVRHFKGQLLYRIGANWSDQVLSNPLSRQNSTAAVRS